MTNDTETALRARMARLVDDELIARAGARLADAMPEVSPGVAIAPTDRLAHDVHLIAARALGLAPAELDPRENLANLGVDSIAITEIMAQISRSFGVSCPPTMFFEATHLDDLASILRDRNGRAIATHYAQHSPEPARPVPAPQPQDWAREMIHRQRAAAIPKQTTVLPPAATIPANVPIAILSMEGRFPQSPDIETLAAHLAAGDDCIEEIPHHRWDWRASFGDPKKGAFSDVKYGGFVPDVDAFDAAFFNISPREAELMDPQHRLFLEVVWHLIEQAGLAPGSLAGRKVALFLGINLLDYTEMVNRAGIMEAQQLTGIGHAFCPNRLSFLLDIHGPSAVIDTACSSALVAVHRAVNAIRHEGCEMAIAGGANLMLSPMQHIMFSKVGMITPDGRCKTFSADANGYARADGVGAVLLKRLDAAERDGDPIIGVIRGSAENHGGAATSLTAPNPKAQARLIVEAHRQAGVDPRSIGMIECHGTGTPLGDPVEVEGLKQAFTTLYDDAGIDMPQTPGIALGSVKSNIGHTEATAGLAGLIKVLLAMRDGQVYRTLHCDTPNPLIDLTNSPFCLAQASAPWVRPVIDGVEAPRRAGLSSFGAGGANVHLVIEEYRVSATAKGAAGGPVIVPISARTEAALREAAARLGEAVPAAPLAALAHTLQVGRDAMRHRAVFLANDRDELARRMRDFGAGDTGSAFVGQAPKASAPAASLDPAGKAPEDIAHHWSKGGAVNWAALYPQGSPRRIALPGYAFQRKRFWLPQGATRVALEPVAQGAGDYTLTLSGAESFLTDHRVGGVPVLPGVAYLELARAAAVLHGITNPALRQVVWMAPLRVENRVTVTCRITVENGKARAEILTGADGDSPLLHAQMRIESGAFTRPQVDLSALRIATPQRRESASIYASFDAMGLGYGPAHRVIDDMRVGPGQVLTRLKRLRADLELDSCALHPGLLDGALQSAIGLVAADAAATGAALPFAMDSVDIFGPMEGVMWAHVRAAGDVAAGTRRMNIDLIAEDGSVRVALGGFATREQERAKPADLLTFKPVWRPFTAHRIVAEARRIVLNCGVAIAVTGADCRRLDDDPQDSAGARLSRLSRQILALLQSELPHGPLLVQVLLSGAETLPLGCGLGAMLRSINREHPGFQGQTLMVETPDAPTVTHLDALRTAPAGAIAQIIDGRLCVQTWEEQILPSAPAPWQHGGIYLITGGTGALGKMLARDIVESAPDATVILAARSAPDAETARWIDRHPGLYFRRADLCDPADAAQLIADIRRNHGQLTGVIHAAGVLRDAAFLRKTEAELVEVLAPKVAGIEALDRAIADEPLDFMVLFSSISGVMGNAGQADYAAANGFLDGFAQRRETRRAAGQCHGRTVSIAWPLWRDGGMGMDAAQERLMRRTTGLIPLAADAGRAALAAALAASEPCVMAAQGAGDTIRRFVSGTSEVVPEPAASHPPSTARLQRALLTCLLHEAAEQLKVAPDDLEPDEELTEYGFDSIAFTQFSNRLNDRLNLDLTPTVFFEFPTLEGLAGHLANHYGVQISSALGIKAEQMQPRAVSQAPARIETPTDAADAVAIIGMSGQFPGAPDIDAFWSVLHEGRDCIREIPAERWDWRDIWGDPLSEPGKCNVKWGGFIDDIGAFDAPFFGLSTPEARMMDPQQRLLLTQAWRVMEDAGYAPRTLAGSQTGVFIGTADTGYSRLIAAAGTAVEGYAMTGLAPSLGPNRISYHFDFHGPSVAVETACSSALIAVHRAIEALAAGHCTAAIAGGINALLLPDAFVGFSKAGMLSPEGRCKPFSAGADGYARGEGVGLVMLKPLAAAQRDGDRIHAVIRASGENHGGRAASLTAPNPRAQAALLRDVYRRAGFDPRTVSYIEAHGTGTPLGDPIEVEALQSAFGDLNAEAEARHGPAPAQNCAIGSVKSNIGHLELAAGIAGLIKVVLQMRHGEIARSLGCDTLNPYLKLEGGPFRIASEGGEWARPVDAAGNPLLRRAGVSSFGFGGSNAHVVVEEYIAPARSDSVDVESDAPIAPEIVILSARSETQLDEMAHALAAHLNGPGRDDRLCDIAQTLQCTREPMDWRLGLVARDTGDLAARLNGYLAGECGHQVQSGRAKDGRRMTSLLERDDIMRVAANGLAERGHPEDLLALWVGGFDLDWHAVRGGRVGGRITLPGYPFAKTRLWIDGAARPVALEPQTRQHSVDLDGSESFLRDHLVAGRRVLPGVIAFDLLRNALATQETPDPAFELIGHTWTRPIDLEDGAQRVCVTVMPDQRYEVTAHGANGDHRHAEGTWRHLPLGEARQIDLAAERAATPERGDPDALYARFDAMGLCYGPAQRAIREFRTGPGRVLARLEHPDAADHGRALDPAILDGALQALLATQDGDTGLSLPYTVRRVSVYGPTTARMWAVIRPGVQGEQIEICDDAGRVMVALEDFSSRPVQSKPQPRAALAVSAPSAIVSTAPLGAARQAAALACITAIAGRTLEVEPDMLDPEDELGEFGFDSITMTAFAARLNSELSLSLTPADFFEFATLSRLAAHVCDDLSDGQLGLSTIPVPESAPIPEQSVSQADNATVPPKAMAERTAFAPPPRTDDDPIVIVGQSGMFPMAEDIDAFWENLQTGRDCISRIPADRWDWQAMDGDPRSQPDKTDIHWGGFCDGIFAFDPLFFNISPREARLMDPQQRLMLMHAWKAIEDAGHSPRALAGGRVGVFVATSSSGYRDMIGGATGGEGYVATGAVPSIGPNRISYFLDFRGPSEPVETACSSSLVALHRAVQAIAAGDCDMALVGGVNTIVTPEAHINFAKVGMLSRDGRCKTFSADANGYVRGEGAGMILIRRRSDAERSGDPILAVIRATGINHGGHANSLTAPNTQAQTELITRVYNNAGIDPRSVGYIEAHGTGTALGDPVEINALKSAFAALPRNAGDLTGTGCRIGALKTNIGHLELAAGVAGVIKVLAQFRHRRLAPSLHCDMVNPYIDLDDTPFSLIDQAQDWLPVCDAMGRALPLRAGISSFGFGGVNAHVVLEEYRPRPDAIAPPAPGHGPVLIVLSAQNTDRLAEAVKALAGSVSGDMDLYDLAHTLQVGRHGMAQRLAITCDTIAALVRALALYTADGSGPGIVTGRAQARSTVASPGKDAPLDEVARLWVGGAVVDWAARWNTPRPRLRLPTYPFARDEYRIDGRIEKRTEHATSPAKNITQLDPAAFYLRDHVVQGRAILPGAMSVELIRRAAAQDGGAYPVALSNLVWRRPISPPATLHVTLEPKEGGHICKIIAEGAPAAPYVQAEICATPPGPAVTLDIETLWQRCVTPHDPDWLYARYAALGITYGPGMRAVRALASGGDTVMARLSVPGAAETDEAFGVHPAILDGAFQAVLAAFDAEGGDALALPFGIDRIEIHRPTSPEMVAYLRKRPGGDGVLRLDIDLVDGRGEVAVRISGFSLRLLKATPAAAPTATEAPPVHAATSARWVIDAWLVDLVAREAEIAMDDIAMDAPLEEYGIDSIMITRLTDVMESRCGPLPGSLFFEHRTLAALAGYLAQDHAAVFAETPIAPITTPIPVRTAPTAIPANEPIAIIGIAGRYPGARDLVQFWDNLAAGRDSVTEVPPSRWDHSEYYDPKRQPGKTTGKWGGFVDGHDRFDPMFFNIAPREAAFIDPQERLFLQCAWETLEDAGYTRARLATQGETGVFVGVMYEEYQLYGPERTAAGQPTALTGSAASIANRVSYFCDFHGPSIALDTMCSSSLSAIHLACDSLRAGSCATALAGGVNLTVHPNKYIALAQARFLSSNGRCESFGQGGDGYVPAEGVGAVLLKPLAQAMRDGDRVHGVILGSALNHGGKTNGYTVPNPQAQGAVITAALARAGVAPEQISYVEAHGTGTKLGDPIEIAALSRAFGVGATPGGCAIGSVKSNIGHGESAAGVAGLTKVLLQMRHGQLAPSLHAETLNPKIDFAATPFLVQRSLEAWDTGARRIAGLSSFGAGGSNAHFILAEHRAPTRHASKSVPEIYPFSARDPERLDALLARFRVALASLDEADLPSVAFTLQEGREGFEARLAIVANGRAELIAALDDANGGADSDRVLRGRAARGAGVGDLSAPLPQIAHQWTIGQTVDWAALRRGAQPQPISLPTYPFAEDHCWLHDIAATPGPQAEPLPLLFAPTWREQPSKANQQSAARRIVVICGSDVGLDGGPDAPEIERLIPPQGPADERFGFCAAGLLRLVQRVATAPQVLIQVVVPATGPDAGLEGMAGLLRCAVLEHSGLRCQLVAMDFDLPDPARVLAQDAADGAEWGMIRHLRNRRLIRHWQEIAAPEPATPWRQGGVYLLTGGAGGIGLHVAQEIATAGVSPTLWLTGRSALDAAGEVRLEEIRSLGATVHHARVDITDRLAVADLVQRIEDLSGPITGVFHGAGITRDGLLAGKSEQTLHSVLAPKVAGVLALDDALGDRALDFMVLFGSVAGALGNPGQGDYGAANAFLDRFAELRNARGSRQGHCVAIDWPYWRDGGMRMDARAIAGVERAVGVRPLETGPALEGLRAILTRRSDNQVLVLDGDHERLRALMQPPVKAAQPARATLDATVTKSRDDVVAVIKRAFCTILGVKPDHLKPDETIDRFGVDSVSALDIIAALEPDFGALSPTLLFEFQTIARLADELAGRSLPEATPPATARAAANVTRSGDVAIIAVAGRYPGADTIEAFAEALRTGRDCITELPLERQALIPRFSTKKGEPGASHCKWGGFLSDIDRFDAEFFGYTPRAADLADPQERLFLQTVWHLFERAGLTRAALGERYDRRVGLFVGAMYNQYPGLAGDLETRNLLALSSYAGIANRASFFFDLQGPSVAVDSMCSAGLQAVHQACQSLASGESRLAVAGGVNLSIHPAKFEMLSRGGLAGSGPDSRAFAPDGDGYLPSEGVGAVLLKPMTDALRDGDRVLGVIRASRANHAGHSAGFAVPDAGVQAQLIGETLDAAGINASDIGYVEAAATGARLGDAIELRALAQVFADSGDAPPALGSVKASIGHAEAASGLAQLTKVLLQLQDRRLFPSCGFARAAEAGRFDGLPLTPQIVGAHWPARMIDGVEQPRRALIQSFGAGGSNVALILEQAPPGPVLARTEPAIRAFPLSARTPERLDVLRQTLAAHLRKHPDLCPESLARTLQYGRENFECRANFTARNLPDLIAALAGDTPLQSTAHPVASEGAMVVLPGYPFARDRHWLPEPGEAPSADAKISPLALIRRTLAAELGIKAEIIDTSQRLEHLGADSMVRTRLFHEIEGAFGLALTPADVDLYPTPDALAAHVSAQAPADPPESLAPPARQRLSAAQEGLWVNQTLFPDSAEYNVPLAFRGRGLSHEALGLAMAWLIERHPILGARVDDTECGLIMAPVVQAPTLCPVAIPKEMDLAVLIARRVAAPFDLSAGVLRIEHLIGGSLDPDESIVLIVVHHIATDGTSSAVITADFWTAYEHFAAGGPLPEPTVGADYAEFAGWEAEFITSERGRAQRRHWLNRLDSPAPTLHLPFERVVGADISADSRIVTGTLPPDVGTRLIAAAQDLGISPASLALAALAVVLHRYSGETDIVVGVPTLRRPARRFARTVGYCANTITPRLSIAPETLFATLAQSIHGEMNTGLANADYPFAEIARVRGGTSAGAPPWRVSFAYQNFGFDPADLAVMARGDLCYMPDIRQSGGTGIDIEVVNGTGGLRISAAYDANRYEARGVERFVTHLQEVLRCGPDAGHTAVGSMPLLTAPELERALAFAPVAGGKTAPPVHTTIFAQMKKTPGAVAMVDGDTTISFRTLELRVKHLARLLTRRGIKAGDRVGVLLPRGRDAIATLLATLGIGAVWVPLDPEFPNARLSFILRDADLACVMSQGDLVARIAPLMPDGRAVIDIAGERPGLAARFARLPRARVAAQDPAYIIYTSGSTGTPKGVVIGHGALAHHCAVVAKAYGLGSGDRVLQFAPLAVDTAIEQILPPLSVGASLILRPAELPTGEAFLTFLRDRRVSVADLPPVYLHELLRSWTRNGADISATQLRLMIVGGETLPPEVAAAFIRMAPENLRLINAYGPTEATVTALIHTVTRRDDGRSVPIGRPLPGTEVHILDPHGNPVPDGIAGELFLGGPRLAIGYHGREELTRERFAIQRIGGRDVVLYRTGDLASFGPDTAGTVFFHGRSDDQVKIRGHRIETGEIEAAILACGIADAAVIVTANRAGDAQIVAHIATGGAAFDMPALRKRLAARLPRHMLPSDWVTQDALPKMVSGKTDRGALTRPRNAQETAQETAVPTAKDDRIERDLAALWAEVLGRDSVDPDETFEEAGGHSLLTVRLIEAIADRFGQRLSVFDLAEAPRIPAQAALLRIRGGARTGGGSLIVPLRHGDGALPPVFLVHPVGGSVSQYAPLAEALDDGRAIHGIRARGLERGEETAPASIEGMARLYLSEIRNVQPHGPYTLIGWSIGGIIAHEIARQSVEAGESIAFLGMIDSYTPAALARMDRSIAQDKDASPHVLGRAFLRDLFGEDVELFDGEDPVAAALTLPRVKSVLPGADGAMIARLYRVFATNVQAVSRHEITARAVPATLFCATQNGGELSQTGWRALPGAPLSVHPVEADHYSIIAKPCLVKWSSAIHGVLRQTTDRNLLRSAGET
ncbi:non-ribosomal peptide synthetase [Oceaniovalibus sp. ACAM 378]|uniref:non-ribosomal peptide synthetase n=1 Tax=Oceaniovalibus sp. ACAM 378 TaxID=2599923 RepID=UPI001651D66B|nr:non-ribosomal peptide synthetase [Oceaniovalibus sp. ACAM 378]